MTKVALKLDKHILVEKSTLTGNTEYNAIATDFDGKPLLSEKREAELNLDFLISVGKTIADKKNTEIIAMDTMLEISSLSQTCLFDVSEHLIEMKKNFEIIISPEEINPRQMLFRQPEPTTMMMSRGLTDSIDNIKKAVTNAGTAIKGALNSIGTFLSSINPMKNGLKALSALAQFLLCPEESFIGDIMNAIESVKDIAKSIKPKQLLEEALGELTKHILNKFPTVNNLLNFFLLLGRVFDTGFGSKTALEEVQALIKKLGKKYDYLDNYTGLDLITDLLDPTNNIHKNPNIPLSNALPKEIISKKCSALGKIISQLESSYRSGMRFEDIIIDNNLIKEISDKELRDAVNVFFGVGKNTMKFKESSENAKKLGNHDKTAINNTLSTVVTTGAYLTALDNILNNSRNDSDYIEVALNAIANITPLLDLSNTSLKRMISFEEGIKSIKRRNDYFDVSNILIGR